LIRARECISRILNKTTWIVIAESTILSFLFLITFPPSVFMGIFYPFLVYVLTKISYYFEEAFPEYGLINSIAAFLITILLVNLILIIIYYSLLTLTG